MCPRTNQAFHHRFYENFSIAWPVFDLEVDCLVDAVNIVLTNTLGHVNVVCQNNY